MTYTEKFHCSILQGFPDLINNSDLDFTVSRKSCKKPTAGAGHIKCIKSPVRECAEMLSKFLGRNFSPFV